MRLRICDRFESMECTLEESRNASSSMATKQRLRNRSVRSKGRKKQNRSEAPQRLNGRSKSHPKQQHSSSYTVSRGASRGKGGCTSSVGGDSQTSEDTFPQQRMSRQHTRNTETDNMALLETASSASTRPSQKLYDDAGQSVQTGYSVKRLALPSPHASGSPPPIRGAAHQHYTQQRRPALRAAISVDEVRRRSLFDEDSTASSAFVDLVGVPPQNTKNVNESELVNNVIERQTSTADDSSAFVDLPLPSPYSSGPIFGAYQQHHSSSSFLKEQDSASHNSHDLEDDDETDDFEQENCSVNSANLSHAPPAEVQANTMLIGLSPSTTSSMSDSLSAAPPATTSHARSATKGVASLRRAWHSRKAQLQRKQALLATAHEDWCEPSVNEDWPGGPPLLALGPGDEDSASLHSRQFRQVSSSSMCEGDPRDDTTSETPLRAHPSSSGGVWCFHNWLVCSS